MNVLIRFLKQLEKEHPDTRIVRMVKHSDPGKGIEYNEINATHRVSKCLWKVDIARSPQIIKNNSQRVNLHGSAWAANPMNLLINYGTHKVHGRRR